MALCHEIDRKRSPVTHLAPRLPDHVGDCVQHIHVQLLPLLRVLELLLVQLLLLVLIGSWITFIVRYDFRASLRRPHRGQAAVLPFPCQRREGFEVRAVRLLNTNGRTRVEDTQ